MEKEVKFYRFETDFTECISSEKQFGTNKSEWKKHFNKWLEWCIDYIGNANVIRIENGGYSIDFKKDNHIYQADWVVY